MENETTNKKDNAKEKLILFVIGVLLGATIATVASFVCVKTIGADNSSSSSSHQMPGGTPPEMPSGENSSSSQGGTPPEKPSDDSDSDNQGATSST